MEYNTYLSDDEVDIENEVTIELDKYGIPIEEIDEEEELEIRRIVSNKILSQNSLNEDIFSGSNSGSSKKNSFKNSKIKKKKTMSLNKLNNFIDKEIEDKKPKKFVSKRSMVKKNDEPSPIKSYSDSKRKFNPRRIPYLFSEEYKNRKLCDEYKKTSFDNFEFPTL